VVTGTTTVANVTARHIGTGHYHTCAVLTDGSTRCWGYNPYGQLGDASTTNRSRGVEVYNLTGGQVCNGATGTPTAEVCGDSLDNNCNGVVDDREPSECNSCTPSGGSCTAGIGACARTGALTCGEGGALSVMSGQVNSCAVMHDGRVRCWGYNGNNNLGDGSTTQRIVPVSTHNDAEQRGPARGGLRIPVRAHGRPGALLGLSTTTASSATTPTPATRRCRR
jgi:hypothetical protein